MTNVLNSRVFLVGGLGFVGMPILRELLKRGHQVRLLVRSMDSRCQALIDKYSTAIEFVEGDCNVMSVEAYTVAMSSCDGVIYCAWYTNPSDYLSSAENLTYLEGALRCVQALGKSAVSHFAALGTCLEYYLGDWYVDAQSVEKPETLYGVTKLSLKNIIATVCSSIETSYAWYRLFHLYGSDEKAGRLYSSVMHSIKTDESLALTSGEQIRDYTDVTVIAGMIVDAFDSRVEGVINIGSGNGVSVRNFVSELAQKYDKLHLMQFGKRPERPSDPHVIVATDAYKPRTT
jgi:nucleoside-diphosphate-sugar epimerase